MPFYHLEFQCPHCGCIHSIVTQYRTPDGPGTAGRPLPRAFARVHDKVWCDKAGQYVDIAEPACVIVTPQPGSQPGKERQVHDR